ncbi:MAG: hypothetical protein ACREXT_16775, partial [Gammaproteobacteria bacterium]
MNALPSGGRVTVMKRIQGGLFVIGMLVLLASSLSRVVADEPSASSPTICLAGTFNDWNPADPNYRMTRSDEDVYRLQRFFRAGQYKFKFTVDGGWDKHYGGAQNGAVAQPGTDIILDINRHGVYVIELDLKQRRWSLSESTLDAPQAV